MTRSRRGSSRDGGARRAVRASLVAAVAAGTMATADVARAVPGENPVLHWNGVAGQAALDCGISPVGNPLHESRAYAMAQIAVHDALNAIDRRSRPYAYDDHVAQPVSADAAVAAAARTVLASELACGGAGIESAYQAALAAIPDGTAEDGGVELGEASAAAILAERADYGSDTLLVDTGYEEGTEPGEWRFTSDDLPFAFAPGWGAVDPFVLRDSSQFRPGPPPRLVSGRYAADVGEVQRLGCVDCEGPGGRTPEQTEVAHFWLESSPLQWNRIARTVAADAGLDAWESARLLGLLNMALADGYIGSFDTKYDYDFWRPVTAIQLADTDGNAKTTGDPTWLPLATTPPIPDYDSAHAVEGAAAAQVMRRFFGTDRVGFTTCSLTLPDGQQCDDAAPVLRSYDSFSAASDENGESRVLVGFHFRTAVEVGIRHGRAIAQWAVQHALRPEG